MPGAPAAVFAAPAVLAAGLACLGCRGAESEVDWAELAARRLPELEICELPGIEERLLCGTLEVAEDRERPAGRKIPLRVVVVPARTATPPSDPVFLFEGGPGGAATGRARASVHAGPVRRRDIVLVDQRGSGDSNPLTCEWSPDFRSGELREMFPEEDVRACAVQLAERADLRFYTSEHHADDIEEVRRRLGYGPINIRGGSYGTWAMMVFAQRHPVSTRSLFGIGAGSPLRSNLAERGLWADRTLRRLEALCRAEERCAALAPSLYEMTSRILQGLAPGPRRVELEDPAAAGERLVIEVGRQWLSEQLRLLLYYSFTSRALPWAVHRALVADDWSPLVSLAVLIERTFRTQLATGLVLTIQCSEHMGFDVEAALARGAATLVGNYRLEQQLQGCAAWPHEKRPPLGVAAPAVLAIPTLLISGGLDPVTPPEYGEEVRTLFPNSLHAVIAEGQHGPFDLENSWECVHRVWADFLNRGAVDGLDTSCIEGLRRPSFLVDGASFAEHLRQTLVPMTRE